MKYDVLEKAVQQLAYERGQRKTPARIPSSWSRAKRGAYKSWLAKIRMGYLPKREKRKKWVKLYEKAGFYAELRPHVEIGKAHYSAVVGSDIKDLIAMILKFSYEELLKYNKLNPNYFGQDINKRQFERFLGQLNRIYDDMPEHATPQQWNRKLGRFRKIRIRVFYAL